MTIEPIEVNWPPLILKSSGSAPGLVLWDRLSAQLRTRLEPLRSTTWLVQPAIGDNKC